MIPQTLNYTIEKLKDIQLSKEQFLLRKTTGKFFSSDEAGIIWKNIEDHKWNISEKLNRDVGLEVAALDYFENFYKLSILPKNLMT